VADAEREPGLKTELRRALKEVLPDYMMPALFVRLDTLPLTPNGKLDRAALPVPDQTAEPQEGRVAPRDTLERQLAAIWEQVLKIQPIGVRDNFFDLGGHSLLAVSLFAQLRKALGHNLPLTALFEAPTIEQLAEILRNKGWSESWSSLVPIQPHGSKPPFFCMHAGGGFVLFYRDLAKYLGPDQPVYGLQAQGLDGQGPTHNRVEDMAAHYIKEMRAFQPRGPYFLGGECFGGKIAFEVAHQLGLQGEEVALLALFNTFGPGYPKPRVATTRLRRRLDFLRLRFIDHHLGNLLLLKPTQQLAYIWDKLAQEARPWRDPASRRRRIKRLIRGLVGSSLRHLPGSLPEALQETQDTLMGANITYNPPPYSGKVTLFRASVQPAGIHPDPALGWAEVVTGELEIHEVDGSAIVLEPRVRLLGEVLSRCLEQARATGSAKDSRRATLIF